MNNPSNSAAFAFIGTKDLDQFGLPESNAWNFIIHTNNGNIGIGANVPNPTNKLQIGSIGATGFATNDLAIGNGTNALGILQSNTSTYIGSTTDIVLMPRNNGQGRIGINTRAHRAPLEVISYVNFISNTNPTYYNDYYAVSLNASTYEGGLSSAYTFVDVSIMASNRIIGSELNAYSDAPIKSIIGISNKANDREILNAIQITNYTMKDKVQCGNRSL